MPTDSTLIKFTEIDEFRDKVRHELNSLPSVAARFYPLCEDRGDWMFIPSTSTELDEVDGLPVPPPELWAGYCDNPKDYTNSGRSHFESMLNVLMETGYRVTEPKTRILDLGCAAGRMTRCFSSQADNLEVWGTDISSKHILWCQQNLSPPLNFLTTTTYPHLPFEDNYFSLIYAGSVFTHIGDLEDAWLMELKRILRPGGRLYLTIHDNHTINLLLSSPPGHWLHDTFIRKQLVDFEQKTNFTSKGFGMIIFAGDPGNTQIYHDIEFLKRRWGRILKILAVSPEAYGYQTAVTLTK